MAVLTRNLALRLPAAALLIAAGVLFSPGRATAGSCGDYVTIAGQPAANDDPMPDAEHRTPCHGPNCSNRQNPPVSPVSVPTLPSTDPKQLDARFGTLDSPDGAPGQWFVEPEVGRPIRVPVSIFHPPRHV